MSCRRPAASTRTTSTQCSDDGQVRFRGAATRRCVARRRCMRVRERCRVFQPHSAFCKATECRLANGVPIIWCVCSHSTPYEQRGAADPRQPRRAPSLVSVVRRHRSLERVDLAVQQLQLRNDLSAVLRGHPRRPSLPPQSRQRSAAVFVRAAVKCGPCEQLSAHLILCRFAGRRTERDLVFLRVLFLQLPLLSRSSSSRRRLTAQRVSRAQQRASSGGWRARTCEAGGMRAQNGQRAGAREGTTLSRLLYTF